MKNSLIGGFAGLCAWRAPEACALIATGARHAPLGEWVRASLARSALSPSTPQGSGFAVAPRGSSCCHCCKTDQHRPGRVPCRSAGRPGASLALVVWGPATGARRSAAISTPAPGRAVVRISLLGCLGGGPACGGGRAVVEEKKSIHSVRWRQFARTPMGPAAVEMAAPVGETDGVDRPRVGAEGLSAVLFGSGAPFS